MVTQQKGTVYRVSGPVVTAIGIKPAMYDIVRVGDERLMGEVIQIEGEHSIIQVYEDTSGVKPGEPVENTGLPLVVELGPGLLTSIYDGIQRPLEVLQEQMGHFILRGVDVPGLDHKKKWEFKPTAKKGDAVKPGQIIGTVQESPSILHKVMVPPNVEGGKLTDIKAGSFTVEDVIATLDNGAKLQLMHKWPVRKPRPFAEKQLPTIPLNTGMRILDGLFPIAKGGTAAIPGPFGSGKTVTQQSLAKYSDAKVVVYIGCGERGNEMTEVLTEFPVLEDPQTGNPLMARTCLIANTSNMPVAAREASCYTGITIAEYYRDMGYDVALMADSTSRWAEAMREIGSRLEEMPGEEGYPAYLSARLSEFYERAGRCTILAGGEGSISVIGAVSPAGGDFSEPVTQATLRIVKVFWALDAKLAQRRHFPAINWLQSYSLYPEYLASYYTEKAAPDWNETKSQIMEILQKEAELQEIVQLVGSDALPPEQQVVLETARLIREIYLQQNAYDKVDAYSSLQKDYKLWKAILRYQTLAQKALGAGATTKEITGLPVVTDLARARFEANFDAVYDAAMKRLESSFEQIQQAQKKVVA
ncbi:MAG: V/A-type H+/Na+-transporting ATPase subunit [Thermoplasmata archaeon]|jgi:V/A-type H+-transporting ATPase subunit A|nr:V/A-type H+/Na+-transporting ATPase subunit [Thermoplasmata archaeon]